MARGPFFWGSTFLAYFVLTLDATGSIKNLLFARVKRMAGRANGNVQFGHGAERLKLVTAGTVHQNFVQCGMKVLFHVNLLNTMVKNSAVN